MPAIPRDPAIDSTFAFLREGYPFIATRCHRYHTDTFETRLLLRKAVCVRGAEAAAMFYAPDRFTRVGAMPPTALWLLQDRGSVQLLDGAAHHRRKQMFMELMTPERIARLADLLTTEWRAALGDWARQDTVVLHDAVEGLLCRAVCAWAGIHLTAREAAQRTREFNAMIAGAGAVGPRNWRGLLLRARTERWARALIARTRAGGHTAAAGSPLALIAGHRDEHGDLLDTDVAAVELINLLRPTVAVAWYITFAALALHDYPDCRAQLRPGDEHALTRFVQEVRRFYPFFPLIGGRARQPFHWHGRRFAAGTWVLLDLYGTNHDPRRWAEPGVFQPDRFQGWEGNAFDFIPQGGGDYELGHRCAGEWLTIALLQRAVRLLTEEMRYDVPIQDTSIDLARMPALPKSRFAISNVRPAR